MKYSPLLALSTDLEPVLCDVFAEMDELSLWVQAQEWNARGAFWPMFGLVVESWLAGCEPEQMLECLDSADLARLSVVVREAVYTDECSRLRVIESLSFPQ